MRYQDLGADYYERQRDIGRCQGRVRLSVEQAQRPPVVVECCDAAAAEDPAPRAVFGANAKFGLAIVVLQREQHAIGRFEAGQVVRVDQFQPLAARARHFALGIAEHRVVALPEGLHQCRQVELPGAGLGRLERQVEVQLMLAQDRLGPLALRDIDEGNKACPAQMREKDLDHGCGPAPRRHLGFHRDGGVVGVERLGVPQIPLGLDTRALAPVRKGGMPPIVAFGDILLGETEEGHEFGIDQKPGPPA